MRTVQMFIVRFLVDPAEPNLLRGDLRPMPEGEPLSFTSEAALLELLHQMLSLTGESLSSGEGSTGNH